MLVGWEYHTVVPLTEFKEKPAKTTENHAEDPTISKDGAVVAIQGLNTAGSSEGEGSMGRRLLDSVGLHMRRVDVSIYPSDRSGPNPNLTSSNPI